MTNSISIKRLSKKLERIMKVVNHELENNSCEYIKNQDATKAFLKKYKNIDEIEVYLIDMFDYSEKLKKQRKKQTYSRDCGRDYISTTYESIFISEDKRLNDKCHICSIAFHIVKIDTTDTTPNAHQERSERFEVYIENR